VLTTGHLNCEKVPGPLLLNPHFHSLNLQLYGYEFGPTQSVDMMKEMTHTGMKILPDARLQFRQFPMQSAEFKNAA
jgi:hypothetical protein